MLPEVLSNPYRHIPVQHIGKEFRNCKKRILQFWQQKIFFTRVNRSQRRIPGLHKIPGPALLNPTHELLGELKRISFFPGRHCR